MYAILSLIHIKNSKNNIIGYLPVIESEKKAIEYAEEHNARIVKLNRVNKERSDTP